jgi:FkbM family methyltransferase
LIRRAADGLIILVLVTSTLWLLQGRVGVRDGDSYAYIVGAYSLQVGGMGNSERHHLLHALFEGLYKIPGSRHWVRRLTRRGIQSFPLSLKNRQRLYNFFSVATANHAPILATVRLPDGEQVAAELDLSEDMSRQWYFWGYSGYEFGLPDLLWRLLRERQYHTVIEVGANIGYYTLLLGAGVSRFAPDGKVHAFEPFERVFEQLQRNICLNPTLPVVLDCCAVTDVDGEAVLYIPSARDAGTNASLVAGLFEQKGGAAVPAVRLDGYCQTRGLSKVDLVKMDCEGAEPSVLRGMKEVLRSHQPDLVIEVLPQTADQLDLIFQHSLYHRYLITPEGPTLRESLAAHPHYRDYFLTTTPLMSVDARKARSSFLPSGTSS